VITKVLGPRGFSKRTGKPPAYCRALADNNIIDAFVAENGRICYPLHAERQWREYERNKKRANKTPPPAAAEPQPQS
jgi:hypothetical protein